MDQDQILVHISNISATQRRDFPLSFVSRLYTINMDSVRYYSLGRTFRRWLLRQVENISLSQTIYIRILICFLF